LTRFRALSRPEPVSLRNIFLCEIR
jgi:hypothetical protein